MLKRLRVFGSKNGYRYIIGRRSAVVSRLLTIFMMCILVGFFNEIEIPLVLAKKPSVPPTTVIYPTTTTIYVPTTTTTYKPPATTTTSYKPTSTTTAYQPPMGAQDNKTTTTTLPRTATTTTINPLSTPSNALLLTPSNPILLYPSTISTDTTYVGSIEDSGIIALAKSLQDVTDTTQKANGAIRNARQRRVASLPFYISWTPVALLILTALAGIVARVRKQDKRQNLIDAS